MLLVNTWLMWVVNKLGELWKALGCNDVAVKRDVE
jgi:hypothetical protein